MLHVVCVLCVLCVCVVCVVCCVRVVCVVCVLCLCVLCVRVLCVACVNCVCCLSGCCVCCVCCFVLGRRMKRGRKEGVEVLEKIKNSTLRMWGKTKGGYAMLSFVRCVAAKSAMTLAPQSRL